MPNFTVRRPEDAHRTSPAPDEDSPRASFTVMVDWIALHPSLSDTAKSAHRAMRSMVLENRDEPVVRLTDTELGWLMGKSARTAQRGRKELQAHGIVEVARSATYTEHTPAGPAFRTVHTYRVSDAPPPGYDGPVSPWDALNRARQAAGVFPHAPRPTDLSGGASPVSTGTSPMGPIEVSALEASRGNESAPSAGGYPQGAAGERTDESPRENSAPTPEPAGWALALLALIPDAALSRPAADRAALASRLAALDGAGVPRAELAAAVAGADTAERPYPALSARLDSPQSVRAWNTQTMGVGGFRARTGAEHGTFGVPWDTPAGLASGYCAVHTTIRTTADGCPVCAHRAPVSTAPPEQTAQGPDPVEVLDQVDQAELDRMRESLESTRSPGAPTGEAGPGRAPTPAGRAAADEVRALLASLKK
ncbi:hypothetical protein J0910_31005 [Nocardiopsis sp. CNT-189]|uniref:hypothetical protein n=1 Tax=Nocardiopsis oceanisediminis TaxID=2816862 RepID=UPI003B346DF5